MKKRHYYIRTIEIIEAKSEKEALEKARKLLEKRNMPICKLEIEPVLELVK